MQVLGLQPRISKVFLDHKTNFFSQWARTILLTKYQSLLCQLHQQIWNSLHCFSSSVCFTDKSFNTAWILLGTSLQKIIDTVDNSALSKKGIHQTYIIILFIKLDINNSVVKKLSIRGLYLKNACGGFSQTFG